MNTCENNNNNNKYNNNNSSSLSTFILHNLHLIKTAAAHRLIVCIVIYMAIRPFLSFSEPSGFGETFFGNIAPVKYHINRKINSCGKVISPFLEDQKITLHAFFNKQHFYKQHQVKF